MIDSNHGRDVFDRLEGALARVEAAAGRLQRQHRRARAQYELLDRVGSETLASLDALIGAPAQQETKRDQRDGKRGQPDLHHDQRAADAA